MSERIFLDIITWACERQHVEMTELSEGWLLELRKNGSVQYVVGTDFSLNSQVSAAIAGDKVAASTLLHRAGIVHIPHVLFQTRGDNGPDAIAFRKMLAQSDIVLKPLRGSRAMEVMRTDDITMARDVVRDSSQVAWTISPYFDAIYEIRVVIVDGEVWMAHKKTAPIMRGRLKVFNLASGAKAEPVNLNDLPAGLCDSAVAAAATAGLRMVAVDVLVNDSDDYRVLELNASFSLSHYAQTNKTTYGEVASFYDRLIAKLFAS